MTKPFASASHLQAQSNLDCIGPNTRTRQSLRLQFLFYSLGLSFGWYMDQLLDAETGDEVENDDITKGYLTSLQTVTRRAKA